MESIISVEAGKHFARREYFIDLVKGFLIINVLIGHAIGGWNYLTWDYMAAPWSFNFNQWVFSRALINFTVPVFLFLAGFLTTGNKYGFGTKIPVGRCRRFLTRFVVWSLIYSLIEVVVYHRKITVLSVVLGTNGIQLYYLLVMLQLTILTPLFFRAKNKKALLIATIAINIANNIIHVIYYYKVHSEMPNDMILCTCFICYYTLGVYLRNVNPDLFSHISVRQAVTVYIVSLQVYLIMMYTMLRVTNSPLCATSFITVASITYALASAILIMRVWWRVKDVDFEKNPVTRYICWVGENSLDFFLVHWIFEYYIKVWFMNHVPTKYMVLSNIAIVGATLLLSSIYSFIACKVKDVVKAVKEKRATS